MFLFCSERDSSSYPFSLGACRRDCEWARFLAAPVVVLACWASAVSISAGDEKAELVTAAKPAITSANSRGSRLDRLLDATEGVPAADHPLGKPYQIVLSRLKYIRENVRDYDCVLVKRERIGEQLQEYQFLQAKVRIEQRRGAEIVRPFSVYLHYLAPDRLQGRKVLFVDGQFEGKMLVKNGGSQFSFVTVKVSPDSALAKKESLSPITDLGFERMALELAEKIRNDVRADPDGTNTKVEYFSDAEVDGRECSRIQVTHPRVQRDMEFHIANVFLDSEWKLPLRVEIYDWPEREGEPPPLIGEYTYTRLRLNVGLPDDAFEESVIRGR